MMRTVSIFGFITIVFMSAFITAPAYSQDMNIGFVNENAILQRMPEMRAVEQRLQNFRMRKIEEIRTKQQEFQMEAERFQQRQSVLSESARQAEEERLINLQRELQQFQQTAEQEVQQQELNLLEPVIMQIRDSISKIAASQGFDYILKRTTFDGTSIILYVADEARERSDITNAVMLDLGI